VNSISFADSEVGVANVFHRTTAIVGYLQAVGRE
jgi:hypothetical protein